MQGLRIAAVAALALLAACDAQLPGRGEDEREAEGEVLGGSISDDMLPLDQVKSQSPVLRETRSADAGEGEEAAEGAEGEALATEEGAAPAVPAAPGAEAPQAE
ncbi:MAG: hypothetical protein ACO25F_06195 [Erythrobacter sp.]